MRCLLELRADELEKTRNLGGVSQALLQSKVQGAGSIGRVPAAEIEVLVLAALRHHLQASGAEPRASRTATAFLFIRHVIDASCISPSGNW